MIGYFENYNMSQRRRRLLRIIQLLNGTQTTQYSTGPALPCARRSHRSQLRLVTRLPVRYNMACIRNAGRMQYGWTPVAHEKAENAFTADALPSMRPLD
jgi:hypothetical protein